VSQSVTELEKILKYSFLQPLSQEDRSAHKLGSLNEERVRSSIKAIVEKLGWQLVDLFECSLLRNKLKEYLATSLDGWLVIRYESSNNEHVSDDSDSEDAG
jgi:G:T-mismatch repair DNA endonuclease (very short patch repair protein)